MARKPVVVPSDLTTLTVDALAALLESVNAEFDEHADAAASGDGDANTHLQRATELADAVDSIRAEQGRRETAAAERAEELLSLRSRVHPPEAEATDPVEGEQTDTGEVPVVEGELVDAGAGAVTAAGGVRTQPRAAELTERLLSGQTVPQAQRRLNPSLSEMQARVGAPGGSAVRRETAVLLASADIPGVALGSQLRDMDALVAAIQARARNLPVTRLGENAPWYPVAALPLKHKYNVDLRATAEQINDVLVAATNPDALVAAGGWCAPSEISYDFYNIVCEDGMLDVPTVGINRGGMRWPTSASYADIVNNFWTWNETQDIAAVTGTAQSGTKSCSRVPCPSYNEARLRCDGFCLTVGNLMEDAFPELIANHTRLTFAGQAHRLNTLRITELVNGSTPLTGYGAAGSGLVAPVLGAIELSAIDYREKYRMCADAVLEVVLPRWLRGGMRSDLRKRTNGEMDFLTVTDAQLMNMFDILNVRVQWVADWQVGTTGLPGASTAPFVWPTTVQFMMYAAGTWVWGRGLQLNLGVVRDSTLNQTNDHTAEWMEECWLMAKVGHESRLGTIAICSDGTTGAADLTACVP